MSEGQTALILGGGGVTGIAWELGVLFGLAAEGLDAASTVDVVIGTSAGAFAGFAAVSGNLDRRYREQSLDGPTEIAATLTADVRDAYARVMSEHAGDPIGAGRAFGTIAASAPTTSSESRAAVVRDRLGAREWPRSDFRVTAIDADTGELVVLDRTSGLSLEEAACATGAVPGVWPLVNAGGRRWIDGGMISTANAHLAGAFDRALILAPVTQSALGDSVDDVVIRLTERGNRVLALSPDESARESIGPNPFDPSRRELAARAGERQGRAAANLAAHMLREQ